MSKPRQNDTRRFVGTAQKHQCCAEKSPGRGGDDDVLLGGRERALLDPRHHSRDYLRRNDGRDEVELPTGVAGPDRHRPDEYEERGGCQVQHKVREGDCTGPLPKEPDAMFKD